MKTKKLKLEDIKPYWHNPRKINEDAINKVAESIKQYGFNQPLVVDKENVIVVGHTRYFALKKLGETEVEAVVLDIPEEKIKEYRLADNRLNDLTQWDFDKLYSELRRMDSGYMTDLFTGIDIKSNLTDLKEFEHQGQFGDVVGQREDNKSKQNIICPECHHEFIID